MYRKSVLPNGVRLVTEVLPHCRSVALGFWLEAGSRDETPGEGGLSHFLEHMAFKGTPRRSAYDLAREIDQLGGTGNAFTTRENTCFHIKVLGEHLPRAADLLLDLVLHPVYDPVDLERERSVILEEIAAQEDTPEDLVQVHFAREFWRDSPLGASILGEAEDIARYSREELLGYREAAYHPERLVVAAAGQVEHERLLDLVGPALSAFANGRPPRERQAPRTYPGMHLFPRDLEQAHLCLGTPGLPAGDPRRFVLSLLQVILGGNMSSRLFQVIREELGLVYSIYAYLSFFKDTGLLEICAGASPQHLPLLMAALNRELAKLKEEPVSPEELAAAQDYLKSSILLNAEDCEQRMLRLAKNEINFGHYLPLEDLLAGIARVTREEILEMARELLHSQKWALAALGPVEPDEMAAMEF